MNNAEFQLRGVGDPRLAVHATSAQPAWLWSADGTRILWANPVAARLFGATNGAVLAERIFGPADAHRRQVAQLANRLPPSGAIRLERLRGFGAALGALITCGCARLEFSDGSHGILVVSAEPLGRAMPLIERLQGLVEGIETPIAAFARDGMFVGASDAARSLLGFRNLSEAGLDQARSDALKQGRFEAPLGIGHLVLQRVGSGADVGLVALIAPGVAPEKPADPAVTAAADYEYPATSGEAPAEFAVIDEFEESPAEPAAEHLAAEPPPEPEPPIIAQPDMLDMQPSSGEGSAAPMASEFDTPHHEPSPYVEAVADEPTAPSAETPLPADEEAIAAPPPRAPSWLDEPMPNTRRHPLRFMWQMDLD